MRRLVLGTLTLAGALAVACSSDSDSETESASSGKSGEDAASGTGGTPSTGGAGGAGGPGTGASGGVGASGGSGASSGTGASGGSGGAGGAGAASGTNGSGGAAGSPSTDSGSAGTAGIGAAGAGSFDAGLDAGTSIGTCSSTLPGVCIRFPQQQTSFTLVEARAGITFRYEVVIEQDVDAVITLPQDAGRCGSPSPGALYVLEQITGGGQLYCICDSGLCFPPPETPVTLVAGVYRATFTWDGMNWGGPSDTGEPIGAPFPAGSYNLAVNAVGRRELDAGPVGFVVTGVLGIELVP